MGRKERFKRKVAEKPDASAGIRRARGDQGGRFPSSGGCGRNVRPLIINKMDQDEDENK